MAAADEAAAGLVPSLAQELVDKIPGGENDPLAEDLGQTVAAEETPSSTEAPAAQDEHEAEFTIELPNFEPEIPEDVLGEIDMPDFDLEAEREVEATVEDDQYTEGYDGEERKKRVAAEKRVAWLEGRLVKQNQGKWAEEARKYFPLSAHVLDNIKADSRRAYLRQAKAEHEKVLPIVKPLVDQLKAMSSTEKASAKAEGRAEAAAAWGQPTVGPGTVPLSANSKQEELQAARNTGNLSKVIGVLFKQSEGG